MSNIQYVGMTVANMEQSIKFYTEVLSFQKIKDLEVAGDDWSKLQGIFGLRMRVVQMQLGSEMIVLMEYLTPQGRPIPVDSRSNDRWFQHIAIAVKDMDKAYQHLRQYNVKHTSTSPQTLPENLKSAGVEAFYFKDPDGHNLELITFPPDKGDPKWLKETDQLFLGIDHSAVGVKDAQASFGLYRDRLKLELAAEVENYGSEFEHVTCVFGSRIHVNSLKGSEGIGFELLEYIAPTDGKNMPVDSRACDLWHYQTVISVNDLASLEQELRSAPCQFISPGIVKMSSNELGFSQALSIKDLDGHVLHLVAE
ncbi:glyoxalase [Pleurocapsa sp. CCALA 161]|uniref:VOC family protein n=1 Tax=Pleurocapsa sp. CCALA 161 TaxID=2107688 RepID=UPI000D07CD6B|nr:VOC family protein [Pleurocapsa sp. CCALA 161]PSB08516.1 glyoxalase [Pleurocapsa sp. CCALA 161]